MGMLYLLLVTTLYTVEDVSEPREIFFMLIALVMDRYSNRQYLQVFSARKCSSMAVLARIR